MCYLSFSAVFNPTAFKIYLNCMPAEKNWKIIPLCFLLFYHHRLLSILSLFIPPHTTQVSKCFFIFYQSLYWQTLFFTYFPVFIGDIYGTLAPQPTEHLSLCGHNLSLSWTLFSISLMIYSLKELKTHLLSQITINQSQLSLPFPTKSVETNSLNL